MDSPHNKNEMSDKKDKQEPESPNETSKATNEPDTGSYLHEKGGSIETDICSSEVPPDINPNKDPNSKDVDQDLMPETSPKVSNIPKAIPDECGDHTLQSTNRGNADDDTLKIGQGVVNDEESNLKVDDKTANETEVTIDDKIDDNVKKYSGEGNCISNEDYDNQEANIYPEPAYSAYYSDNGTSSSDTAAEYNEDDDIELIWDNDEGNDNSITNNDDLNDAKIECDGVEKLVDENSQNYVANDDSGPSKNLLSTADHNIEVTKADTEVKENIEDDTHNKNRDLGNNTDSRTDSTVESNGNDNVNRTIEKQTGDKLEIISTEDQFEQEKNQSIDSNSPEIVDKTPIKMDHGLRGPDVMLEIPTQELIDIDDTDLSIGMDQSMNSPDDEVSSTVIDGKAVENNDGKVKVKDELFTKVATQIEAEYESYANASEKAILDQDNQQSDVQPSSSSAQQLQNKMTSDTSEEMIEVSDSLCLLAESSRVMEDDDDQDEDEDGEGDGDGDDDDDFDQDESSNQMTTAEHSEDSNAQPSETDTNREEWEVVKSEIDIESTAVESRDQEFQFKISSVASESDSEVKKAEIEEQESKVTSAEKQNAEDIESAEKTLEAIVENKIIFMMTPAQEQSVIETVRLSDTSDNEADVEQTSADPGSKKTETVAKVVEEPTKVSPSKTKKLDVAQTAQPVFNIVDLEESSSEDDIQEVTKAADPAPEVAQKPEEDGVTSVNLPTDIEVMCTSAGNTSEIVTKEGEVVISGVPKPPPLKPARLNTSEVSIKTASSTTEATIVIPEAKSVNATPTNEICNKQLMSLEIFSLDSDEDEPAPPAKEQSPPPSPSPPSAERPPEPAKCVNQACPSAAGVPHAPAEAAVVAHYDAARRRRPTVCVDCLQVVVDRKQKLIDGIKGLCPLLELGDDKPSQQLVEISDSDSDEEPEAPEPSSDVIGEKGAKFLEENLADSLNETWRKYNMDARLKDTHDQLDVELQKLENESKEIDDMLNECQKATDKLRNELYSTFKQEHKELPPMVINDTPSHYTWGPEDSVTSTPPPLPNTRQLKRRAATAVESQAKRPAIPLGYAPLDADTSQLAQPPKPSQPTIDNKADDDKEVSVVKLSAESAPADLPPPGEIIRPPIKVGMSVFGMRNAFGPWLRGKIIECHAKTAESASAFTMCRVKFDHKIKNPCKVLYGRSIAYSEPATVRMTIGTRIVALFKDQNTYKKESYYSGVVAEIPNPVNHYRYLVFFDDGYAQYVEHRHTRLVCESSPLVWEEVHAFSREFVREYLLAYPERPMVRLHRGQSLKTEWNGKWWSSRILEVDASLARVLFLESGRKEWIYRGSTRLAPLFLELQAAERHRQRPLPRSKAQSRTNMPYVEYTRSDEQESNKQQSPAAQQQQTEEIRRQRAVAKKSTAIPPPPAPYPTTQQSNLDTVTSRVVYYTPKNAVKPLKMAAHTCGPKCKRSDVLSLKDLRTYNPLAKPLLSGWERQIVRFKGQKEVMYRAPCGRRLRSMRELHRYLRVTHSELPVDLFDFHHSIHCLAEFVLNKCLVGKKDLSHGKENVPVPCVNYYDESLPEFCSYNTERTPTAGVPLNLDPEFLCGCDCTDDCEDKSKCACWKMTLEGARTIGLDGPNVGYEYKRLPEPLPSGIYECNSRCKCKHTCLNRVAQHPLQLKLQVFKTLNRGWGIRALNDVPKGAFLCVYAGNLLTDATANLDGLNEGDEYLAELDYIEVVEQMKEGFEEDIPEADKKLDKKELGKQSESESQEESSSSEEDAGASKSDKEDDDFRPKYEVGFGVSEFKKELRKRDKAKKKEAEDKAKSKDKEGTKDDDDCITISDDEEVREPSRFTAQAGMGGNDFVSKYRSVRAHFGKDEACYIMDAKVQGNIGRYLNHSCLPNVFVQNVFVDTHDPRFPWVAFFALSHVKAGTELTWNYNYDVGSVPGKVLYCYCGTTNCRGRLL